MKPSDLYIVKSKLPLSASTLARNMELNSPVNPPPNAAPLVIVPVPVVQPVTLPAVKMQPSTDEAKLNKTEAAYYAFIKCLGFAWIGVQNVTLKLADDTRYTVDFVTVDANGHVQGREVKGFMRDDANVKIKVAARMFPWIEFQIVRKTPTGWEHQTVKP